MVRQIEMAIQKKKKILFNQRFKKFLTIYADNNISMKRNFVSQKEFPKF